MIDIDFERLRPIGLTASFTQHLAQSLAALGPGRPADSRLMRITEVQRDACTLDDGQQQQRARAVPALHKALQAQGEALTVGDWVLAAGRAPGELSIVARLPPLSQIVRRANDGHRQVLASNVDTALLVMGLDADFNPRRMERTIAMVRAAGVAPVAVLTKMDLAASAQASVDQLRRRLPADMPVLAVNGLRSEAREALLPWLGEGQTLVLLGASGAGKSTLTNTLIGQAMQDTGAVRRGDGRGQHTTTARSLHRCAEGACIIDTPGLRTWRPDVDEAALAAAFEDIDALASLCQFRNCRHTGEPGCAVLPGVDADRLANYRKLMRDAHRGQETPLERSAVRAKWKRLHKAGAKRAREKRGSG